MVKCKKKPRRKEGVGEGMMRMKNETWEEENEKHEMP